MYNYGVRMGGAAASVSIQELIVDDVARTERQPPATSAQLQRLTTVIQRAAEEEEKVREKRALARAKDCLADKQDKSTLPFL